MDQLRNHQILGRWHGVVGIHIHGLKNRDGKVSTKGADPFYYISHGNTGKRLSSIVKCYNPAGSNSKERYDWIKKHFADAVEEAISIRKNN